MSASEAIGKVMLVSFIPALVLITIGLTCSVITNTLTSTGITLGSYFIFAGFGWFVAVWVVVIIYANLPEKTNKEAKP